MPDPEQLARQEIDALLSPCGWMVQDKRAVNLAASRGAPRLTADVSDSAEEFFKRRGFVPQQRNTTPLGDEWLANTTMEKKLAAKERTP